MSLSCVSGALHADDVEPLNKKQRRDINTTVLKEREQARAFLRSIDVQDIARKLAERHQPSSTLSSGMAAYQRSILNLALHRPERQPPVDVLADGVVPREHLWLNADDASNEGAASDVGNMDDLAAFGGRDDEDDGGVGGGGQNMDVDVPPAGLGGEPSEEDDGRAVFDSEDEEEEE